MKYYDKNLSKINNNIKNILLVIVIFFLGFLAGYIVGKEQITGKDEAQNKVNNAVVQQNEIN